MFKGHHNELLNFIDFFLFSDKILLKYILGECSLRFYDSLNIVSNIIDTTDLNW